MNTLLKWHNAFVTTFNDTDFAEKFFRNFLPYLFSFGLIVFFIKILVKLGITIVG